MNAQHRSLDAHTSDFTFEGAVERVARNQRDVRRRATHVESDRMRMARRARNLTGRDDTARRTGEQRIRATKAFGIRQSAGGLHEPKLRAG